MSKALVTFFSASGVTAKMAKKLADAIGDSGTNMQILAKGAEVLPGKRFKNSVSSGELKSWAEEWL